MKNILLPAIIQDYKTKEVLMLGYMDKRALSKTKKEGIVWFFSRSRKKLWKKGETSGNFLEVKKIFIDCDQDAFVIQVKCLGNAVCHTGKKSCFIKIPRFSYKSTLEVA